MAKFPITLKPEYFAKALSSVGKQVTDNLDVVMRELAETGAEYARAQFDKAEYDGEHDTVVTVEGGSTSNEPTPYSIVARGKSVKFIEFGTGVLSEASGSKGRDVWVFSANGRNIRCTTPQGHKLDPTKRAYYKGPRDKKRHYINFEYRQAMDQITTGKKGEYRVKGEGGGTRTLVDKHGNVTVKPIAIKDYKVTFTERKRVDPRTENYITFGNKPNYCIKQTARYVGKIAPEVIKKHFKTT